MSEPTGSVVDRNAALTQFSRARDEYLASYEAVPDDALRYVPEGEDYTLGGLVVHVTDSILHYAHVLDEMQRAGFQRVRVVDPEDEAKQRRQAMILSGFGGDERAGVFDAMRAAHQAMDAKVRALSAEDYPRKAPVLYGPDASEPYPTYAGDILGWLTDHYTEHTQQVAELQARWRASR